MGLPVQWIDGVNVTPDPITGTITKTSGGADWNAGARSQASAASGLFFVEFKLGQTTAESQMGITSDDPDQSYPYIDFSIVFRVGGTFEVLENGSPGGAGSTGTYTVNDLFRVEAFNGAVKYYKNGSVFYTSVNAPVYPIFADCSINTPNGKFVNVWSSPTVPAKVTIRGCVRDFGGTELQNATVAFRYDQPIVKDGLVVASLLESVNTDSKGEFTITVLETESLGATVNPLIQYTNTNGVTTVTGKPVVIPYRTRDISFTELWSFHAIDNP